METKEMSAKCCRFGGKHKKVLAILIVVVFLAIAALAIAAAGWKMHESKNRLGVSNSFGNDLSMMNRGDKFYPVPPVAESQFAIPQDAAKSGEIAIVVNDLEVAKKSVADAAGKNGGNVFATFISYASSNSKNGSIVVQVPVENFDSTFSALKSVGSKIVQESTQIIAPRNIYPMMQPLSAQGNASASVDQTAPVQSGVAIAQPAIYPPYQQGVQNKGYVRVVFVDYGNKGENENKVIGGANSSPEVRGLWAALILKSILLIVLFAILLVMLRRIFRNFRAAHVARKAKRSVHVVRQMPKVNKRVVKVQRKR